MIRPILIVLTTVLLISCTYLKADPAPDAGFIEDPSVIGNDVDNVSPFQRGWASPVWPEIRERYKNIIVAEVDTSHMVQASWWQGQASKTKEQLEIDRKEIAGYLRDKVIQAYTEDPNKKLKVVEEVAPNTLVLELAIVELIPAKVYFNAVASVAGIFLPGVGYATSGGAGSIAIEGRVRDAESKEILAIFADRESDKTAPINIAQYSWYQGSKQNIDDWAEQLVALRNASIDETVEDSSPFTLSPW